MKIGVNARPEPIPFHFFQESLETFRLPYPIHEGFVKRLEQAVQLCL